MKSRITRRLPEAALLLDPERLDSPLDWFEVFGRGGPVEIEVGCGKGRFLLELAERFPDRSFVGLEYARAYLQTTAARALGRGLRNVRLARVEAAEFFEFHVPDASVSAFHLLYPDPWPKKRHHKRRLIRRDFLAQLRRVLAEGAEIDIATDHLAYFEWMLSAFEEWKGTFTLDAKTVDPARGPTPFAGRTNYEIKYLAEGRPLHLLTGRRTGF